MLYLKKKSKIFQSFVSILLNQMNQLIKTTMKVKHKDFEIKQFK